jgi:arylsulfatase A-like enzyme
MNGIIAGLGPSFRRDAQAPTVSILDVTPTLLALQGLGAPEGTDGRVAEELLERTPQPPERSAVPSERAGEATPYTEEEEEAVRERLRGLGYIE